MMPLLVGDTHGSSRWIARAIDTAGWSGNSAIIHVGDLGIWPGGRSTQTWETAEERLAESNVTMYVAPGNHEDYDQIEALTPRDDGWLPFREHILLAPRGHRTEWWGRSILWLGGAGSVDRTWRVRSDAIDNRKYEACGSSKRVKSWWPQEALTDEDVERAIAGGHADVMICHDAPIGVQAIDDRLAGNPHACKAVDIAYAEESRRRLTQVVAAVQPEILIHGHFHFRVEDTFKVPFVEHETRVYGLGADGSEDALGILDLEEMSVEIGP
ncbi:metallophosphoesterase family protein [Demequina lutea]|uniref:Calcineurin-like phosphoesterase domain-containing protein n=1 Tax=Demequina lutea TaxID=431489 RepID=A0A7Y9Z7F1_9MICO|nr:metallophosphoesterase [Demequina lutea]NYI40144.1 hypothetical protein [Demequina lutea]